MSKSPLSTLPPEGDEEKTRYNEIQKLRSDLKSALDARQNQLFDPTLLAMAQGFLAPTKTGSFGESLGYAAGAVGKAQEGEAQRAREIAAMRLEIAQQEFGEMQKMRRNKALRDMVSGQGAQPTQPAQPAADEFVGPAGGGMRVLRSEIEGTQAAAPQAAAPQAAAPSGGGLRNITAQDIVRIGVDDPDAAKLLADAMRLEQDRYKFDNGRIVDLRALGGPKVIYDANLATQKQEEYSTPYGKFPMRPSDYKDFVEAEAAGRGREWIRAYTTPKGAPAAEGRKPERMLSVTESNIRTKEQEAEAAKVGAQRGEMTASVLASGKASRGLMPIYENLDARVSMPGMDKVMGVFERPNLIQSLGGVVEEAVRVGNFTIGIPQIRALITNAISANDLSAEAKKAGVTPQALIDNLAVIGQGIAMTQFNQRQGLGSGTSVSNFEQQMVNAMGPTIKDTVGSFRQKLAFMKNKSEFEVSVADAMEDAGVGYSEFIRTPEYKSMEADYKKKQLETVYGSSGAIPRPAQPQQTKPGAVRIIKIEPAGRP